MNEEFSDREYAMFDFELIEDEIDIDSIEELKLVTNNIDGTVCMMVKINELVQAVKQLNKRVKKLNEPIAIDIEINKDDINKAIERTRKQLEEG